MNLVECPTKGIRERCNGRAWAGILERIGDVLKRGTNNVVAGTLGQVDIMGIPSDSADGARSTSLLNPDSIAAI